VPLTADEIARGVAIDFGSHVAAVWEDREPLGVLDGNDLVMHHLGGFPEIVSLATLAKTRPVFSVRVPEPQVSCRMKFAGDVVLADDDKGVIDGFEKGDSDGFFVNLEGIPSMRKMKMKPRYDFRFPPERLAWLKSCGVDAVSLANNHAADAGAAGIVDGMAALEKAGIAYFGAGKNEVDACRPLRIERKGVRMAIFGISCFEMGTAATNHSGVAVLPQHRGILAQEFQEARDRGESIVVMMHWGNEYDVNVDDEQRRWTRWLVSRGATTIVGSHPHVIQRDEMQGGAEICYSLGNAVYPRSLKGADSGAVCELRIFPAMGTGK
jgi:poly-gamma-glutamate capsule biosynthesis protein CapA/YwtB (metallophosphatase superfamily)